MLQYYTLLLICLAPQIIWTIPTVVTHFIPSHLATHGIKNNDRSSTFRHMRICFHRIGTALAWQVTSYYNNKKNRFNCRLFQNIYNIEVFSTTTAHMRSHTGVNPFPWAAVSHKFFSTNDNLTKRRMECQTGENPFSYIKG